MIDCGRALVPILALAMGNLATGQITLIVSRPTGTPNTPAEIAKAVRLASFEELTRKEDAGGFAGRPEWIDRLFRVGRAGQWKEGLTPEQVGRIVADHREEMARFGYLPA